MKQQIQTIAEQINYKQLALFGFKFVYDDAKLSLCLIKGCKYMKIILNESLDTYEIETYKTRKFELITLESLKNIYCDQLENQIEQFFKINYLQKHVWS